MNKKNFVSLTPIIITITIICFNIIILTYPQLIINSTKKSLLLWFNNVIPSLYPFIILNNILKDSNGFYIIGNFIKPLTKFFFKHKEYGGIAFATGLISGYPLGGITTVDLLEKKLISLEEANFLIMFTNNAGPLFIIGTIGVSMFKNSKIGYFLLFVHILSAFFLGIFLSFFKKNKLSNNYIDSNYTKKNPHYTKKPLVEIISESILTGNSTILLIGGFIMFYGIIISILEVSNILTIFTKTIVVITNLNLQQATSLTLGFFEMTTGINYLVQNLSNSKIDLIILSGILSFGGLSIHGQTLSKIIKTKIKIKNYFFGKTLHSIFSMFFTYLFFDFFNFESSVPVFNSYITGTNKTNLLFYFFIILFINFIALNFGSKKN